MIRLGVSVEGATEREFVQRVLAPHLAQHGIHAVPIDMRGNVSLERLEKELRGLVHSFDHVTTLYDFYGFKRRGGRDVETLEQDILLCVEEPYRRFVHPYVQLHEFESLLFSSPEAAENNLSINGLSGQMEQIVRECGGAEAIDDGYETCPSRRLIGLAPGYDKKLHGPVILQNAGIQRIRQAAPRFDGWLTRLEGLQPVEGESS